ncbi:hypothetical protein LTR84_011330 [Exophiala bonariae]|uniref:FAD/NAD(P)-binding domain-containing protein n=1 Tax=Exophiala bonariae TaxID=1690606 RepID=A0AAV9MVP4_9EURO|nr:hypothetical protein LTR84_011330 [Exophiala bonariae]
MAALPNRPEDFDTANHATVNGTNSNEEDLTRHVNGESSNNEVENIAADVIIIGGGFGGMYGMHQFRKLGLSVKLLEAGSSWGGTWHWNRYPGARVDSETPYYSLSIPEVYKDWTFTERFPGHEELRRYFQHVDKTLDLSRDAYFNTIVTAARYDTGTGQWHVKTDDPKRIATCKYLVMATGSSYKKHFPAFKNLDKFKGRLIHSALYPDTLDVSHKKVLVIGSGATGVQIVQTLAHDPTCQLTASIRTPNIALPMRQRQMSAEEQNAAKSFYQSVLQSAKQCSGGFPYNPAPKAYHEATPAERRAHWEEIWGRGGFAFLLSNYREFLADKDINRELYAFWADKVRARVRDPVKREIVAPATQPHWLGTKRPSLEQDFYEMIDQEHVTLLDLQRRDIAEFTASGVVTVSKSDENDRQHHDYDIVILATGYDSLTGSLLDAGLTDINDTPLSAKWRHGTYTYLGLTIPQMPNLFMVYSPQAPTALSNGPPIIEIQIDWIAAAIAKMRAEGVKYIDARSAAAEEWRDDIQKMNNLTLFPETDSWYMGANVPGKPREQLVYLAGVDTYARVTREALDGWKGFDVVKA